MNYSGILKNDQLNGSGLRVVLFVSGCSHHCKNCHNPETWDPNNGFEFDSNAKKEIFDQLDKDYISGITFSGGDPLFESNRSCILDFILEIRDKYPNKTIWLYTGYEIEELIIENNDLVMEILNNIDILVDGKFEEDKASVEYHWAGSTNQKVIDIRKSLSNNFESIILFED